MGLPLRFGTLSDLWSLLCCSWETAGLIDQDPFLVLQCGELGSVLGCIENNLITGCVTLGHLCAVSGPTGGHAGVMNHGQGQRLHRWDGNRSPPPESASLACSYTASLGSMLMWYFTSWNLNLEFVSCHFLNTFYIMEKLLNLHQSHLCVLMDTAVRTFTIIAILCIWFDFVRILLMV